MNTLVKCIKPEERGVDADAIVQRHTENGMDEAPLGELAGIDVTTGLGRMGGKSQVYRSLLIDFRRNYAHAPDDVRAVLECDDDLKSAQHLAHTIKGVAGNLGMRKLHATTLELEKGLKQGVRDGWPALVSEFKQELDWVVESISSLQLEEKQLQSKESVISKQEVPLNLVLVTSLLTELRELIVDGNSEAEERLDTLQKALSGANVEDVFTQLEECLINRDFKGAQESLMDIAKVLDITMKKRT